MRKIDWDRTFNDLSMQLACSDNELRSSKNCKGVRRRRDDLERAFSIAKRVAEENPDLNEKQYRKKVYSFFIPGLLSIIAVAVISTAVRMVIEYIIKQLYSDDQEQNHARISVSAK